MTEPHSAVEASVRASRLHALAQHTEWKEFEKLIDKLYDINLTKLKEKENPEARGAVNVLEDLMSNMYRDIKYGDQQRKKVTEFYRGT